MHSAITLVFLALAGISVIANLLLTHFLVARLRSKHHELWLDWGSPWLIAKDAAARNVNLSKNLKTLRFYYLNDSFLDRICIWRKVTSGIYVVFLPLFLLSALAESTNFLTR